MTPEPDGVTWHQIASWVGGLVGTLASMLWFKTTKEMNNRREAQKLLFAKLEEHAKEDRASFDSLRTEMSKNHAEILNTLIRMGKDK